MPSNYDMTSNVRCDENMTSQVHHSERASVISDCLVLYCIVLYCIMLTFKNECLAANSEAMMTEYNYKLVR